MIHYSSHERSQFSRILHFQSGHQWVPVPEWGRFFIDVGYLLGKQPEKSSRTICAIAVPTRAYAAVLCATGVVESRISIPIGLDATKHFSWLCTLPKKTTVTYRLKPTLVQKGWLMGCTKTDNGDWVEIQLQAKKNGGLVYKIPASESLKIEVASRPLKKLHPHVVTRTLQGDGGLLSGILEKDLITDFIGHSRLECVIVGNSSRLREEITNAQLAIIDDRSEAIEGKLQEALRPRQLVMDKMGFRSDVYSAKTNPLDTEAEEAPLTAIFEGSTTFLKWRSVWPGANWIVILDRTDYRFEDASSELNRLYASERTDANDMVRMPAAQQGLEYVAFEARR